MRATISAENDIYTYEITLSDEDVDDSEFVELIIRRKNEDYFETWLVAIKDLHDLVKLFNNRRE